MSGRVLHFPAGHARRTLPASPVAGPRTAEGRVFDRGVFRAPFLVGGCRALLAVDGRGVAIATVPLRAGVDVECVGEALYELLRVAGAEPLERAEPTWAEQPPELAIVP